MTAGAREGERLRALSLLMRLLEVDASCTPTEVAAEILDDLVQRLSWRAANEDPSRLLSSLADLEVRCLAALLKHGPASDGPIDPVHLLAQIRWLRYLQFAPDAGSEELRAALRGFETTSQPGRSVVPPLVREYLDGLQQPPAGQRSVPSFVSQWHGVMHGTPGWLRMAGESVLAARRAVAEATNEAELLSAAARLCSALVFRYVVGLRRRHLDEALAWGVPTLGQSGALPVGVFAELVAAVGSALALRAQLDGNEQDQAHAVDILCDAVRRIGGADKGVAAVVEALGMAAAARPNETVETLQIDRAIAAIDGIRAQPADHDRLLGQRMLLHIARYDGSNDVADLDEAIKIGTQLTSPLPSDEPFRRLAGSPLAHALHRRFERTGSLTDLSQAITHLRRNVRHGGDVALDQEHLGLWLYERYGLLNDPADLNDAVSHLMGLVRDHGAVSPALLTNAIATAVQAGQLIEERELREVVGLLRAAIDHPDAGGSIDRVPQLVNLAAALRALYLRPGPASYLEEALARASEAVALSPPDHSQHAEVLESYALMLLTRGAPADLNTAVAVAASAVEFATGPSQRARLGSLLGEAYVRRAETEVGTPDDRAAGLAALQTAARTPGARPDLRRTAAYEWATASAKLGDFGAAATGYAIAIDLIADPAWRATPLSERRHQLAQSIEAARSGAACAIRAGRPELAVELLERGRGVIRGQIFQRRADLELIRSVRPELADRMQWLQQTIEGFDQEETAENFWDFLKGAAGVLAVQMGDPEDDYNAFPKWLSKGSPSEFGRIDAHIRELLDEQSEHPQDLRLRVIAEWDARSQRLREEPGLDRLGRPPTLDQLQAATALGAVVMVNVSSIGCDALVVTTDTVRSVNLPDLDEEAARQMLQDVLSLAVALEDGDRSPAIRRRSREVMTSVQDWLWGALAAPVLSALELDHQPSRGEPWPRIWWCLTGPLTGLPVHAATSASRPDANVMDRAVSSYTSSLAALLRARRTTSDNRPGGHRPRLLAVGMPETPHAPPLRGVEQELAEVRRQLPDPPLCLLGRDASVQKVEQALGRHDWLHLACHGTPTLKNHPARLYLHNGSLNVHGIGWLTLDHADLAYLSACHTADTSFSIPDEADHLAAAFQAAGFRHVIGTLWGAGDRISAWVASQFYRHLSEVEFRSGLVAEALHHAVRRVRQKHPDLPFLWAPFVHFGP
jgi:hypothetical protein